MTEGIWIAIIGGAQAIMLGLLGKVTFDGARSRRQVENHHGTNLRDNIDENQTEILNAVGRVERDVIGMKKDIGRLDDRDLAHGHHHERVDDKLGGLDDKLDKHLEWSREYVAGQEK